jgi:Flp pilus assembly protein TadG
MAAHGVPSRSAHPADLARRAPAQALVELALVLPMMLLLLLGMVEFGRAYVAGIALEGAAREGARLASTLVIPTGDGTCASSAAATKWCADVTARIQQAAQPETVSVADITVCAVAVTPPAAPPPCTMPGLHVPTVSGQAVRVTAHTFKQFYVSFLTSNDIPWLGFGMGLLGVPIDASSTMRVP